MRSNDGQGTGTGTAANMYLYTAFRRYTSHACRVLQVDGMQACVLPACKAPAVMIASMIERMTTFVMLTTKSHASSTGFHEEHTHTAQFKLAPTPVQPMLRTELV